MWSLHKILSNLKENVTFKFLDASLRYYPIISLIQKHNYSKLPIIEIGSGSIGIGPYIKQEFIGVDKSFSGLTSPNLIPIKQLPFESNLNALVICVDVLEHLDEEERKKTIEELIRISGKVLIIVTPIDKEARAFDQFIMDNYSKSNICAMFLEEHLKFPYPETNKILFDLQESAKKYEKKINIKSFKSGNIIFKKFYMRFSMDDKKLFYKLSHLLTLMSPAISKINKFGKCYQKIFLITFDKLKPVEIDPNDF